MIVTRWREVKGGGGGGFLLLREKGKRDYFTLSCPPSRKKNARKRPMTAVILAICWRKKGGSLLAHKNGGGLFSLDRGKEGGDLCCYCGRHGRKEVGGEKVSIMDGMRRPKRLGEGKSGSSITLKCNDLVRRSNPQRGRKDCA